MVLPDLPAENEDPWFAKREAFDLAVKNEIENLLASKIYVDAAITALVNSSPAALDTLNELAAALGNDANFAATITSQLSAKAPLDSPTFTGDPKAPTPAVNDNDTSIATTAFVAERSVRYAGVISSASTDRTATLAEAGQLVRLTANTGKTQRMPDDATAAFPIGSWVDYVSTGANDITFVAAGTATVDGADLTVPRYVTVRATKIAANSWLIGKPIDALPASTNLETQQLTSSTVAVTPASLAAAASSTGTADRLARYSSTGKLQSATPTNPSDVAIKSYVDGLSGIQATIIDAVGDLIVGAGADTPARFAKGPNGSVLVPDSSQAAGLRWATQAQYQTLPPVGSTFTSSFWQSINTTSGLRSRSTARMPLAVPIDIGIDQAAFNVTVIAATAGQTAYIKLMEFTGSGWTLVATLGTAIPLTDAVGEHVVTFPEQILQAGKVYGFELSEEQAYDTALRVTQGGITGPGIGASSGYGGVDTITPYGINNSLVPATGIPVIRVRRSS